MGNGHPYWTTVHRISFYKSFVVIPSLDYIVTFDRCFDVSIVASATHSTVQITIHADCEM